MTAKVLKFEPSVIEGGVTVDENLDEAKTWGLATVLIIGETDAGEMYIGGSHNSGTAMILMERAKHALVFGND